MSAHRSVAMMWVAALVAASALSAAPASKKLELRGQVLGRGRFAEVTLFGIDSPYTAKTITTLLGEFRFGSLPPGMYSVIVARRLGEIRRTVVVSPSLADKKGRVHVTIRGSVTEAAADGSGALVSKSELLVPKEAQKKYSEAEKRLGKRDVEGARASLQEALEIAPHFGAAWNLLGVFSYQAHDWAKAEEYFRKALETDPGAFAPTTNLGGVLLNLNRPAEALEFNLKAQAMHPHDAMANAQLGMTYFSLGDYDRAETALRETERIDPSHSTRPQLFLARIYLSRGDRRAALRELRDAVSRYPDSADAPALRRQIRELESVASTRPATTARFP